MREPIFDKATMSWHQPLDTPSDIARDVMHTFTADRDDKIRARLIELGWVPPDQVASIQRVLAAALEAAVRKGVAVHWDVMVADLLAAHDALPKQQ